MCYCAEEAVYYSLYFHLDMYQIALTIPSCICDFSALESIAGAFQDLPELLCALLLAHMNLVDEF